MAKDLRAEGIKDPDGVHAYALARIVSGPLVVFLTLASPGRLGLEQALALVGMAAFLVATTVELLRAPTERVTWVALVGDVVSFGVLVSVSGGADSHLRYIGPVLVVAVALHFRPAQVAATSAGMAAALALSAVPDLARSESEAPLQVLESLATLLFTTFTYLTLAHARQRVNARIEAASDDRRDLLKAVLDTEAAERRRLTHDLHEGPLQRMLALRQDLEEAREGDTAALDYGEDGLVEAIRELREVIAGLHPVALDHGGLAAALRALADRAATEGALASVVHVADDVDGLRDTLLVSVTRELLGNVVAHARATAFELHLMRPGDGLLVLVVSDDGVGFDPGALSERSLVGLAAVRERVDAVGGDLELEAAPGEGTRVSIRLPL